MHEINYDLFFNDLSGKLTAAYARNAHLIEISVAGEAALRRIINRPDQTLGEEERTHRNITVDELDQMLKEFRVILPDLRREQIRTVCANDSVSPSGGSPNSSARRGHLRLAVSN
jgi:hypothetical protein